MTAQETIKSLCRLVTTVGNVKFGSSLEHDCFCTASPDIASARVNLNIIEFIKQAVLEKLERELHDEQ